MHHLFLSITILCSITLPCICHNKTKVKKIKRVNLHLASSVPIIESALFSTGLYAAHDVDNSIPVSLCHPRHIHLSVGATPWNSMTVSFSISNSCPIDEVSTVLSYGPTSGSGTRIDKLTAVELQLQHEEHKSQFNYSSTKHEIVQYQSDHMFHVPLVDLKPSQIYNYQIMVINNNDNVNPPSGSYEHQGVNTQRRKHTDDDEDSFDSNRRRHEHVTSEETSMSSNDSTSYNNANTWADNGGIRGNEARSASDTEFEIIASSPALNFETIAPPGTTTVGTKMAIVADLGQTYNSSVTMLHMYKETVLSDDLDTKPASIILCGGDCSYSDSNPFRWDAWFKLIEPLIARTPFQLVAGNHEVECDADTFDVFTPYEYLFRMPQIKAGRRPKNEELCLVENKRGRVNNIPSQAVFHYDYGNSFYSFTHGITRVIALNCYTYAHHRSRQYRWLKTEFKTINRDTTPWVLVLVHCPLYNTFYDHHNEKNAKDMLRSMEPLFLKHRVNFVISGHSHGYMRTTGIAHGKTRDTAPIYMIVGEGGNRENHSPGYKYKHPEKWVVKRDNTEYGFGTMDFMNSTWAHWKWIRNFNAEESDFTDDVFLENQWLHEFDNVNGEKQEESY